MAGPPRNKPKPKPPVKANAPIIPSKQDDITLQMKKLDVETLAIVPSNKPAYKWRGLSFDVPPLSSPAPQLFEKSRRNASGIPAHWSDRFRLLDLPKELQLLVIDHLFSHHNPIPIHPDFRAMTKGIPPIIDYRLLHSCRQLYVDGLPLYYTLNTFSIDLHRFGREIDTFAPKCWPKLSGHSAASTTVRRLHMRAREAPDDWVWAIRCLRGFEALEEVVFDMRMGVRYDCAYEGVKTSGTWTAEAGRGKNMTLWTGSYDLVKIKVEEGDLLAMLLKRAEVKVGEGGIWVGAVSEEVARDSMVKILVPMALRAFGNGPYCLKELEGLRKGVPSEKEYEAFLEGEGALGMA